MQAKGDKCRGLIRLNFVLEPISEEMRKPQRGQNCGTSDSVLSLPPFLPFLPYFPSVLTIW